MRPFEIRTFGEGLGVPQVEGRRIRGDASVPNVIYDMGGLYREVVRPGAFMKTLRESEDLKVLWMHDQAMLLGRTGNREGEPGFARIWEDDLGLHYDVPDVGERQWALDAVETVRMGLTKGSSIGMYVIKERWNQEQGKLPLRELLEVKLDHVSPVGDPANPKTCADVREEMRSVVNRNVVPEEIRKQLDAMLSEPDSDHSPADGESLREGQPITEEPVAGNHSTEEREAAIEVWRRRMLLKAMA